MTEPISPEFRFMMNEIAATLDRVLNGDQRPKRNAFVLLLAPFDGPEDQRVNYISNANRKDIVMMMKEVIARFEGQPEQKGRG